MDFDALLATLNIRLGDTDNFAFTTEEKEELLTEAFEDEYVVKQVYDTSVTFDTSTYQYARPSSLTTVTGIAYKISSSSTDFPETISAGMWSMVGDNIQFQTIASRIIPDGYTLYLTGNYKYTVDDTITEKRIQQYVLNLAQLNALDSPGRKKALKFVKNDVTMADITGLKRELERKVAKYRARMPRAYEVA